MIFDLLMAILSVIDMMYHDHFQVYNYRFNNSFVDCDTPKHVLDHWFMNGVTTWGFSPHYIAQPVYGYGFPIFYVTSLLTMKFIYNILSKKHMANSNNHLLIVMMVSEFIMQTSSQLFAVSWYSTDLAAVEDKIGLSFTWCHFYMWGFQYLPRLFHTFTSNLLLLFTLNRTVSLSSPTRGELLASKKAFNICVVVLFIVAYVDLAFDCHVMFLGNALSTTKKMSGCFRYLIEPLQITDKRNIIGVIMYSRFVMCTLQISTIMLLTLKSIHSLSKISKRKSSLHQTSTGVRDDSTLKLGWKLTFVALWFCLIEGMAWVIYTWNILILHKVLASPKTEAERVSYILIFRKILVTFMTPAQLMFYCMQSENFRITARNYICPKRVEMKVTKTRISRTKYKFVLTQKEHDDIPKSMALRIFDSFDTFTSFKWSVPKWMVSTFKFFVFIVNFPLKLCKKNQGVVVATKDESVEMTDLEENDQVLVALSPVLEVSEEEEAEEEEMEQLEVLPDDIEDFGISEAENEDEFL